MSEMEKNIFKDIPDEQLEDVAGGIKTSDFVVEPILTNRETVSSGETPKYAVGQKVKIKCRYRGDIHMVTCEVLSVSETRNCGMFYKEFGYSIKILDSIGAGSWGGDLQGKVYDDVYENCIYEC